MNKLNVRLAVLTVFLTTAGFFLTSCSQQETVENSAAQPADMKEEAATNATESDFSGTVKEGIREVKMKAYQFAFDPDKVYLKKGERVRLIVESTDVAHGIDIEGMDINQHLPPGEEKTIEFTPEEAGVYHFHCSVYCGSGHGRMHGEIIVK